MTFSKRQPFLLTFAAIFAVALGCTACSSTPDPVADEIPTQNSAELKTAEAQEVFLNANQALDEERWSEAARLYESVTELDPERWDAHMNRGIALLKAHEFGEATDAFAEALANGGAEEPVVYFNLGNLYQERGLYDHAIDAYRTSMGHAGALDYETLLNIAACYSFLSAYDEARQTIDRAIELRPDDSRAYLSLGLIVFSDGNPDQALSIFDELLASDPGLAPAHYSRAFVLLRMNRGTEALQGFQRYLELDPEGPYSTRAQSHIDSIQRRLDRS